MMQTRSTPFCIFVFCFLYTYFLEQLLMASRIEIQNILHSHKFPHLSKCSGDEAAIICLIRLFEVMTVELPQKKKFALT